MIFCQNQFYNDYSKLINSINIELTKYDKFIFEKL